MSIFVRFLGTGLGIGRIPTAPGTFGTLWGVLIAWILYLANAGWFGWITTIVVAHIVGWLICHLYGKYFAEKDPGELVVDEIAAFPITMLPLAFVRTESFEIALIAGFIAFRIFDIAKPPPIRQLEKMPGALGVMADDTLAAVFAAAALWVCHWAQWI